MNIDNNTSLNCIKYIEDDGSVTLSLEKFDIVVNANNYNDAISKIVKELKDYIDDYIAEPDYWSTDSRRKSQVQFLSELFKNTKEDKIKEIIRSRNGKN
ncbi:hypothetical protein [Clostridium botulinum]